MQNREKHATVTQQSERFCPQCQQLKSLLAFSQRKGKREQLPKLCSDCESFNLQERYRRLMLHRERWQQQQACQEKRQQEQERRVALRQLYEERWCEQEAWYCQQPDRRCPTCQLVLPASAFSVTSIANSFALYTHCKVCYEVLRQRRQPVCCLCLQQKPRHEFCSHYNGYALSGDGTWISLCCEACESAFLALPEVQQYMHIHACCQRMFPAGQVIYGEVDPETDLIRYIGRTGRPKRRHAQHLSDISPTPGQWGPEQRAWYTRRNWIHALAEKGLAPYMQILLHIDVSPLVVEWEQRFIWHGMQQGWPLLNSETMDRELAVHIKATSFDFLTAPFEMLVQQRFCSDHGLVAFLHRRYSSDF